MASTAVDVLDSTSNVATPTAFAPPTISADHENTPSEASTFSDAYNEQVDGMAETNIEVPIKGTEASDDYALTFDSDGEEVLSSQDNTAEQAEKQTTIPNTVPDSDMPSSITAIELPSGDMYQPDPESQPTLTNPSPIHQVAVDAPAADPHDTLAAQPNTYEDIANGDIDIQQLLDNITANAENNALAPTPPASASTTSMPKGLPAHSSLPPRPQILQQPATRIGYPTHDEAPKHHTAAPGFAMQASSFRPPGVPPSIVAAGAPGTSTTSRSGLPPPPTGSFQAPPISTASPIIPSPYPQAQKDQPITSVENPEMGDDADQPWGPVVQKHYDDFLSDERMYVTEGLWDRFPMGSRLFIGKQALFALSIVWPLLIMR